MTDKEHLKYSSERFKMFEEMMKRCYSKTNK